MAQHGVGSSGGLEAHAAVIAAARAADGTATLAALLRLHGMAVDEAALQRHLGTPGEAAQASGLVALARRAGFAARRTTVSRARLPAAGLPALAVLRGGGFLLVARADANRVLVFDLSASRPVELPRVMFDAEWTGQLILGRPAGATAATARFGLGWFASAMGRHRGLLGEVVLITLFIQLFGLLTPLFSMVVIDKVLSSGSVSTLDVLVVGMVAMALFDTVMGMLRGYLLSHTTNRMDVELGARMFDHLTALPMAYFESRPVGALASRVKELESIRAFLTGPALTVMLDVAFTLVFLAVMLSFSAALTGVVAVALVCFGLINAVAAPLLKSRMQDKFASGTEAQSFLVEAINGVEAVKATAAEPRLRRQWQGLLIEHTRASLKAAVLSETTSQLAGFVNKVMAVAVLWYGAHLVMENAITAGTLIAFNMLAGRVSMPVLRLTQLWQQMQQTRVAMTKVGDVLNAQAEPGAAPGRAPLPEIAGRVVLRDVSFRYQQNGVAALDRVSFEVPQGQVVGIVGLSGSGKSTLVKLLQRLHVPERGQVLVDGIDLAGVDPAWLRRQIGVVPQEVMLFNRSVRENIALADPSLPMERVVEAAQLAGAHDFVAGLPEGYDTVIGERGMRLSGGQRQRLALARALVHDPRLLILDEATSSLDYESELIVHRNMRRIRQGRTVFIVAHRLAALREADRILVLEHGRLIEDGTHAALVDGHGRYALLHAFQVGSAQALVNSHGGPLRAAAAVVAPAE